MDILHCLRGLENIIRGDFAIDPIDFAVIGVKTIIKLVRVLLKYSEI
jgi:hypothetical protein